jgi:hypothetical protein
MKAKNHTRHSAINRHVRARREEPLPHELGPHLFAMIRRNLLSRGTPAPRPATQLTFAF